MEKSRVGGCLLGIVLLLSMDIVSLAQEPIKFVGIPIQGSEIEFNKQLLHNGFQKSDNGISFHGQFNGKDVQVSLLSEKNGIKKVCITYYVSVDVDTVIKEYNSLLRLYSMDRNFKAIVAHKIENRKQFKQSIEYGNHCYAEFKPRNCNGKVYFVVFPNAKDYVIALYYENL